MKRVLSLFAAVMITVSSFSAVYASDAEDIKASIDGAAQYIIKTADNPTVGSIGGEWAAFALARSGADCDDEYFSKYISNAEKYITDCGGLLHEKKYTEYSRVVIAFAALGQNPQGVCGYDLTLPLLDFDKTITQGLNGAVWALIALDSADCGDDKIREEYIGYILDRQREDGGWAMAENSAVSESDITAMALTALAPYRERDEVNAAAVYGFERLSQMQNENGGYTEYGAQTSESTAQALIAISQWGIPYTDERFVKNETTLLDNLLTYRGRDGGFAHTYDDACSNLMATEQALYSLSAVYRAQNNMNALFDMSDCLQIQTETPFVNRDKNITKSEIIYQSVTFSDMIGHSAEREVTELARRGILNGTDENLFCPDNTMTRAEFAAVTVRALGIPFCGYESFYDVNESDWFYDYVRTAFDLGIINGVSDTEFNPYGTITREEAAVMLARAAALCGLDTSMEQPAVRDTLAVFTDYVTLSDWAEHSAAVCYKIGILDESDIEIMPKRAAERAEIAKMIYNLLGKAELL